MQWDKYKHLKKMQFRKVKSLPKRDAQELEIVSNVSFTFRAHYYYDRGNFVSSPVLRFKKNEIAGTRIILDNETIEKSGLINII